MQMIYKLVLKITDGQEIALPVGSIFLGVQCQRRKLCLWALVDPDEANAWHRITIIRTNNPIESDPGRFIGMVRTTDGLVWHVFYKEVV